MRAQDEAEFEELVAAVSPRLLRTAYLSCGNYQLAEDAVQSAMVSAYRSWRRVRAAGRPEAYLRRMVMNELMSQRRRKAWSSTVPRAEVPESAAAASPEDDVVEHAYLWAAVGDLPPRQRAVVVLRFYEGLSEAEIAELLGIRPGTVKSQSSAAMAHLRQALAEDAERPTPATGEGR